jgi:hypothetical protein
MRLGTTIQTQVDRRVLEQRTLELEVLALVSVADAYGAELDLARLRSVVNADDGALKRALSRLVDEYLIREGNGVLRGLHELRSHHVIRAIHEVPPPTIVETVPCVIDLIDAGALQLFLTRLLLEGTVADEIVINALARRLQRDVDPLALAASLHALRLVGFRRMVQAWRAIFSEEDVAPSNVGVIAFLVMRGGDSNLFPEPIQRAIARISELRSSELRAPLLSRVASLIPRVLAESPKRTGSRDGVGSAR